MSRSLLHKLRQFLGARRRRRRRLPPVAVARVGHNKIKAYRIFTAKHQTLILQQQTRAASSKQQQPRRASLNNHQQFIIGVAAPVAAAAATCHPLWQPKKRALGVGCAIHFIFVTFNLSVWVCMCVCFRWNARVARTVVKCCVKSLKRLTRVKTHKSQIDI